MSPLNEIAIVSHANLLLDQAERFGQIHDIFQSDIALELSLAYQDAAARVRSILDAN